MADNTDNLGDLSVNITGDYGDLADALQEAQTLAQSSAESISEAITSAGEASGLAGRDLELFQSILEADQAAGIGFEQSLQDIAASAGTLGEEIASGATAALASFAHEADAGGTSAEVLVSTLSELKAQAQENADAFNQALSVFNDTVDAFHQGEASAAVYEAALKQLSDAARDANVTLPGVTEAAHSAAEAGNEGASAWEEFGAELLKFGGIALTAEGLKELATEALETYANVEKATIALAALTGNGEKATEAIEGLKTMALTDALSFPSLVTAYQRMTAFGFESEKIPGILQAAADASAATGRSFDTVTNSIERMALSGTAGARQLATLGLSLHDLASALGVADDEARQAFKDLDVSDRVAVVSEALTKYQGVAEAVAHGVAGQFQDLKTQTEYVFESIGEAIAPAAEAFMAFASKAVLPAAQSIANAFAQLGSAESTFAGDVLAAGNEALAATASIVGLGVETTQMGQAVKETAQGAFMDALAPGVRLATAALQEYSLVIEAVINKSPGADAVTQKLASTLHSLQSAAQMGGQAFTEAYSASVDAARGFAYISDSAQAVYDNVGVLNDRIKQSKANLDDLKASSDGSTQSLQAISVAEQNVEKAQNALNSAMGIGKQSAADYKLSVDGLLDSFNKTQTLFASAQGAFQKINQLFQEGAVNVGQYLEAYAKLESAAKAAGQSFVDVDAEVTKLTQHVTDQQTALDTTIQVYDKLKSADISGTEIATAEAFDKVTSAAKALGLSVTQVGDGLQFSVSDKSKLASDAVQTLVDKFNAMYGIQLQTVDVNGKAVTTMQSLADATGKVSSASQAALDWIKQENDAWRDGKIAVQEYNGVMAIETSAAQDAADSNNNNADAIKQLAQFTTEAISGTNAYIDALHAEAQAADDAASAEENLSSARSGGGGGKGGGGGGGGGNSAAAAGDALYAAAFGGISLASMFVSPTGPVAGLGPGGSAGAWNDQNAAQALANATGQVVTLGNATATPAKNLQELAAATQSATSATNAQTGASQTATTALTALAAATTDTGISIDANGDTIITAFKDLPTAVQNYLNSVDGTLKSYDETTGALNYLTSAGQDFTTGLLTANAALTATTSTASSALSTLATATTSAASAAASLGTAAQATAAVAVAAVSAVVASLPGQANTGALDSGVPPAFSSGAPGTHASYGLVTSSQQYVNPNPGLSSGAFEPTIGSPGGGLTMNFTFSGNTVATDQSIRTLADAVGSSVISKLRSQVSLKIF